MAEFPALPLFTDAYMADTRHLTTLQHGAYLLMLMTAWRMPDCALPDDDLFLARICGLDKRTFLANKGVLLSFWNKSPTQKWEQGRLKDERNYVEQLSNKNSNNAKSRWLKNKDSHYANAIPNGCQTDAPTPTPYIKKVSKKENTFILPEWINQKDWQDYEEMRINAKKPMTDRARALAVTRLTELQAEGHTPCSVLQNSIINNYQGLFPPKDHKRGLNGQYIPKDPHIKPKHTLPTQSNILDDIPAKT